MTTALLSCRKKEARQDYPAPDFRFVPAYQSSRSQWRENLTDLAANLSLYSSTSLNEALELPVSMAALFFECKAFSDWKKSREYELKIQASMVGRLNMVISAIGIVAKTIAGRR